MIYSILFWYFPCMSCVDFFHVSWRETPCNSTQITMNIKPHPTMVRNNNQKSGNKYWAIYSPIRSLACSALLALLACSLAYSLTRGKVNYLNIKLFWTIVKGCSTIPHTVTTASPAKMRSSRVEIFISILWSHGMSHMRLTLQPSLHASLSLSLSSLFLPPLSLSSSSLSLSLSIQCRIKWQVNKYT